MNFVKGETVEVLRPFWMDGELFSAGDLVEMPEREAREFKARKQVRTPSPAGAKASAKVKAA